MTPLAPQEEELLWQLCSPETLEDANFHGPVFGKACYAFSTIPALCVCPSVFPSVVWDAQGRAAGEGNSVFSITVLWRRDLS